MLSSVNGNLGVRCSCRRGFQLLSDGRTCVECNEMETLNLMNNEIMLPLFSVSAGIQNFYGNICKENVILLLRLPIFGFKKQLKRSLQ
ncbi:hypothetical protein CEXT_504031 [Caerostris extrusa]|uniref:Complement Clr-like EGF domain-containing protein n=1 Tax=Caerostris extrusa TaxID=172846 RepID=A0AAV4VUN0_CAEEX|nr:hypothetical protein CEXT_504031 [Caerostris extrusa]